MFIFGMCMCMCCAHSTLGALSHRCCCYLLNKAALVCMNFLSEMGAIFNCLIYSVW